MYSQVGSSDWKCLASVCLHGMYTLNSCIGGILMPSASGCVYFGQKNANPSDLSPRLTGFG